MEATSAHPRDCPNWDYENYPDHARVVLEQSTQILIDLRRGQLDTTEVSADTRLVHETLFASLVPVGYDYFAGHYRGEDFRCLRHYEVAVGGDPRVGFDARTVIGFMREFGELVRGTLQALDIGNQLPNARVSQTEKLLYTVSAACHVFELLLRIHPYANGNGHMARFVIWSVLGRYGYWPNRWSLEPRPPDPPYTELIIRYRNGDREPLERFVLSCVLA